LSSIGAGIRRAAPLVALVLGLMLTAGWAKAQENYEIQVYPSETMEPGVLLTELHSNYTVEGSTAPSFGMLPTQGQEHETVEFTQGINPWSEVGFYVFTEEKSGTGVQWVGDHIRPRVRIPPSWHWPVGVSLSNEIGYARAAYSNPTWSWQMMPIVDQTLGRWYWSVNTTMNWGIHPTSLPKGTPKSVVDDYYRNVSPHGIAFGPAVAVTYQPNHYYNFGIEYYGSFGEFGNFVSLHNQQQQFFPVMNLFVSKKWEINFGAGWGATASTDHLIVKGILGRYFNWGDLHRTHHVPRSQ
jgi:hypothetical protein